MAPLYHVLAEEVGQMNRKCYGVRPRQTDGKEEFAPAEYKAEYPCGNQTRFNQRKGDAPERPEGRTTVHQRRFLDNGWNLLKKPPHHPDRIGEIEGKIYNNQSLIGINPFEHFKQQQKGENDGHCRHETLGKYEKWQIVAEFPTYMVSLKVVVLPSDFIEAEIESLKLEKEEAAEPYSREMEQPISKKLNPGHDIAKAGRLIRKRALRVAIIYIDHLQKKYPNWPEVYEIKALACYLHDEFAQMKDALQKACELGSLSACEDHKMFSKEGP